MVSMDVIGIILTAAIAGIGSGIGVTAGQAMYKAFFEDRVNKFLDKKHRKEALDKITMEIPKLSTVLERELPKETEQPKEQTNPLQYIQTRSPTKSTQYSQAISQYEYQQYQTPRAAPKDVVNNMLGKR
jgi:hypothetical protein